MPLCRRSVVAPRALEQDASAKCGVARSPIVPAERKFTRDIGLQLIDRIDDRVEWNTAHRESGRAHGRQAHRRVDDQAGETDSRFSRRLADR